MCIRGEFAMPHTTTVAIGFKYRWGEFPVVLLIHFHLWIEDTGFQFGQQRAAALRVVLCDVRDLVEHA